MSAIYRGGKLGDSLVEALDVLVTEGKIDGDLAQKVLESVRDFVLSHPAIIVVLYHSLLRKYSMMEQ